jgi:hypothetical protein
MGNISGSMNMRERGLIGSRPLLFVVKVKRPRSEVRGKASLDLGGGKAVVEGRVGVRWVTARRVTARQGSAVKAGPVKARQGKSC